MGPSVLLSANNMQKCPFYTFIVNIEHVIKKINGHLSE